MNLYGNKMSKENELYTCLSVILLDSFFISDKKCYPQIFLEECKYAVKKKVMNIIKEELKLDESDDEYDESNDEYQDIYDRLH